MRVIIFLRSDILDKPFKSFKEQIEILKSRIDIDEETEYYLMRYNYYSIINFYKSPFIVKQKPETYFTGTHFNEIKALFLFDHELRILFFNSFTKLESTIKTIIAYHFSECYKNIKEPYLCPDNYFLGKRLSVKSGGQKSSINLSNSKLY